ncbi:MAG: tetratricopeptide repeat protein, partial [Anaerolineae bacterium]
LAEVHPLLLILDDLQWIDSDSACLLFHLGQRLSGSRILIAGAYRPEELATGNSLSSPGGSASVERQRHPLARIVSEFKRRYGDICMDLSAVSKPDARRFVDLYIDRVPNSLGEEFRQSLFRRSGGQPLFTIEMLGLMVARRDLLEDRKGRWIQGPALDWDLLPARVEAVIEERISRLDDDLRQLLAIASVEGEKFTADVLARATGQSQLEVLRRLSRELGKRHRLVRELGVRQAGSNRLMRYRFAHVLFRQYVYNGLSEGERVLMHRKIAGILESLYEGCTEEIAAQLASHYAGDAERERYYARLAGERAEAMYAYGQAARYLSRALELTPHEDHAERYAILLIRERAYHRQGCRDLQEQDLADLETLAVTLQESQLQAEVALRQSDYERVTGEYGAAIEVARKAVELARAPDRELSSQGAYCEATGHLLWAKSLLRQGGYQTARDQLEQALALISTFPDTTNATASWLSRGRGGGASLPGYMNDCSGGLLIGASMAWRRLAADSHRCLGVVCWHLGQNDEARTHYRTAQGIYDEIGDLWGQATAINGLGVLAWSLGRSEEAESCFDQSRRYHEKVGDRRGQCRALANLADVATYRGDYAEAHRLLGLALPICREIQERWIESGVLNNLGVVADRLGSYDQALDHLHQALRMRQEIGDRQGEAEGLSDLGLVYHHMGEDKASLERCDQALSIIRDLGDPFILAFVLTRMGHALASLSSLEEAVAAYREALWLRKDAGHIHLEVEPLAGLARVALARRDRARALEHVEEILHQLNGNNLNGNDEPLRVYLTSYQVLRANGDLRARGILDVAYHILRERAAWIHSESLRGSFLENVETHRDIVASWKAAR